MPKILENEQRTQTGNFQKYQWPINTKEKDLPSLNQIKTR
jgi:hypothetical protein